MLIPIVEPLAWYYVASFGTVAYSVGLRLDERRWLSARMLANLALLSGGATLLLSPLIDRLTP